MKLAFGWPNKGSKKEATGPWLVNLGCGQRFHADWINLDFEATAPGVIPHDLRKPLPIADLSCRVVYHSHVLEHFPRALAPAFIAECHRILQPGGVLRVVVPDLETIVRLYLQALDGALAGDTNAASRHEWLSIELMDQMVREESGGEMGKYWRQNPMPAESFVIERTGREVLNFIESYRTAPAEKRRARARRKPSAADVGKFRDSGEVHKWMYDRWSLRRLLEEAGFVEVQVCGATESQIPDFARYQLDVNPDGSVRKPDSLFIEARKP